MDSHKRRRVEVSIADAGEKLTACPEIKHSKWIVQRRVTRISNVLSMLPTEVCCIIVEYHLPKPNTFKCIRERRAQLHVEIHDAAYYGASLLLSEQPYSYQFGYLANEEYVCTVDIPLQPGQYHISSLSNFRCVYGNETLLQKRPQIRFMPEL